MSGAPERGPINGGEVEKRVELRKRELDAAIERALPAPVEPLPEEQWPQVAFFAARERPRLHKSLPAEYELIWGVRLGLISGEGQGVGFTCAQKMPARNLAAALRTCADRLDEIADCVAGKLEVPAFDPARLAGQQLARMRAALAAADAAAAGGQSAPDAHFAEVGERALEGQSPTPAAVDNSPTPVSSHGSEGQGTTSPGGTEPGREP